MEHNIKVGNFFWKVVPRTREGILGYLSCGSLKGIGPKTAERIVNRLVWIPWR